MNEKAVVTLLAGLLATRSMMLHRQFTGLPGEQRQGVARRLAEFLAATSEDQDRSARKLRAAALDYLHAAQADSFDFWSLLSIPHNHLVAAFIEREYARMNNLPAPAEAPFRARGARPRQAATAAPVPPSPPELQIE